MDGLFLFLAGVAVGSAPIWLYRRRVGVPPGQAVLVYGRGELQPDVYFGSVFLRPLVDRWELMDLTVKPLELQCCGKEGLLCKDNVRVDVRATLLMAISPMPNNVIQVAQSVGVERAADPQVVRRLFESKALQALKVAFKRREFLELAEHMGAIQQEVVEHFGTDLCGYQIVDLDFHSWEQTPVSQLDPGNIFDAEGIRKITEMTAIQALLAGED